MLCRAMAEDLLRTDHKRGITVCSPRIQPRTPPLKILVRWSPGPLECIGQFLLQHLYPRELAHNPTILGNNICFHGMTSKCLRLATFLMPAEPRAAPSSSW